MKKNKTLSKVVGIVSTVLYVLLMGLLLLALIINFNKKPNQINGVFGYSFAVVQSPSMVPLLNVGDLVIIKTTNTDDLKVGDIIVFYDYTDEKDQNINLTPIDTETYVDQPRIDESLGRDTAKQASESGNRLIIHRIINVYVDDYNVKFFETKGDNNNSADIDKIREDFVCAKYMQSGGFVQTIFQFVASPTGLIVVIVLPVVLTVVLEIFGISSDVRNTKIAEKLLTRKIKYSEVDKDKTKLAELLSEAEKVYLYDISSPEDKTNLAIVLWENDVDKALILYDQSREKYYEYFKEQFSAKQQKELNYLKIRADLIFENPLLDEEDIDKKAKEIYNKQKEKAKNDQNTSSDGRKSDNDANTENNEEK